MDRWTMLDIAMLSMLLRGVAWTNGRTTILISARQVREPSSFAATMPPVLDEVNEMVLLKPFGIMNCIQRKRPEMRSLLIFADNS